MTAFEITETGVYDIPAETYHADPVPGGSLSSSGARKLLRTCPARFKYELDHPETPTKAMELGTAAHRMVLGVGAELVVVDAKDWRTKAAKEAAAEARTEGKVPLLPHQHDQVEAMAAALTGHDLAAALLGGPGKPEQAIFWQDAPSKVWRRALLDWLPAPEPGGRLIQADYKTADSAHPGAIRKSIETYGYHMQAAWYGDAIKAAGLADEMAFFLVVQETAPPYLVSVVQMDAVSLDAGRFENRKAIELYRECMSTGRWPAYVEGLEMTGLPPWAENRFLQEVTS